MTILSYACDGGCIMLGNNSFRAKLPNGEGDGQFKIYICETNEEFEATKDDLKINQFDLDLISVIDGDSINIYGYDCHHTQADIDKSILVTIRGRYRVYAYMGDVIFKNEIYGADCAPQDR